MPILNIAGRFVGEVTMPKEKTLNGHPNWFGESKNGTPFIAIPLVVTEGPQQGHEITSFHYLSDAAFENTIARLKEVFGFNGDLAGLNRGVHSFVGMPVSFESDMETYEGKTRAKVKWLNPPGGGGGGIKPPEAGKLDGLLKKLNSRSMAIAKNVEASAPKPKAATPAATAAAASSAPAAAPVTGDGPPEPDDVPF